MIAILRGDARNLPLPDGSVDLIVTSPPYFGQRDYRDNGQSLAGQIGAEATPREYVAALLDCTREWMRVLRPHGSLFVVLGDKYSGFTGARWGNGRNVGGGERGPEKVPRGGPVSAPAVYGVPNKSLMGLPWRYAIRCTDELGLILRRDIIWRKPNGLPESVTDRCATSHEYLFHMVKQPRYYSACDEIREPHAMKPQRRPNGHKTRQALGVLPAQTYSTSHRDELGVDGHPLGKMPGSVWEIASQPLIVPPELDLDHFAAFPFELPRRCILGWSPAGICAGCGEGRRPITASRPASTKDWALAQRDARDWKPDGDSFAWRTLGYSADERERRITGYACACTPFTDHPASERASNRRDRAPEATRPHGDYARKQAGEYERVGPWREYHLDGSVPPPSRPAVVLDPFSGTGTTLLAADVLGRHAIGTDRSADYCRLARWRTSDPGERARAMQVPKPPVVPDGQDALFDIGEAAS